MPAAVLQTAESAVHQLDLRLRKAIASHMQSAATRALPGGQRAALGKRLSELKQRTLQEWNATCKGQKVVRQQEHATSKQRAASEQTSFERKESEWRSADIANQKKGADVGGGGLDGWCAKQSLN